jgi:hypothetical protein
MTNSDELLGLGEQLRQALADERRAIGELDHARLVTLADTKRELVSRLSAFDRTNVDPRVRELFTTLRAEAHATALLVSTANAAVRMLLGYETAPSYDRRARAITHGPSRILAAY